jgi:signal transduction histidine kinase
MSDGAPRPAVEPYCHKLLSLSAHELRTPLGPITGYLRMVRQIGSLTDNQQELIRKVESLCGRLPKLADELSALAQLEEGTAKFNRGTLELGKVISQAKESLPDPAAVTLEEAHSIPVVGDAARLRSAFSAILTALLRQLPVPELVIRMRVEGADQDGTAFARVGMAAPPAVDDLMRQAPEALVPFAEFEGGMGLAVPIARRVLNAHDSALLSPPDNKAAAVVIVPVARQ